MRSRVSRVEVNKAALDMFLATNDGAKRSLAVTAKAVENRVTEIAPTGTSLSWPWRRPMRHGWFKDSIRTRPFAYYWRVESTDPFAHLIEWGSVKNPVYAPFRRAMRLFHSSERDKTRDTAAYVGSGFG